MTDEPASQGHAGNDSEEQPSSQRTAPRLRLADEPISDNSPNAILNTLPLGGLECLLEDLEANAELKQLFNGPVGPCLTIIADARGLRIEPSGKTVLTEKQKKRFEEIRDRMLQDYRATPLPRTPRAFWALEDNAVAPEAAEAREKTKELLRRAHRDAISYLERAALLLIGGATLTFLVLLIASGMGKAVFITGLLAVSAGAMILLHARQQLRRHLEVCYRDDIRACAEKAGISSDEVTGYAQERYWTLKHLW